MPLVRATNSRLLVPAGKPATCPPRGNTDESEAAAHLARGCGCHIHHLWCLHILGGLVVLHFLQNIVPDESTMIGYAALLHPMLLNAPQQ
jgi:hypothetical protein